MGLFRSHQFGCLPNQAWSSPPLSLRCALLAIRSASTPQEAMCLYKLAVLNAAQTRVHHLGSHAAVFTLKACSHLRSLPFVRHFHAHLLKAGHHSHVYVATALLHGYVLASFRDACLLFDEIPNRNIVTVNTMISGYAKQGNVDRARSVFDEMPERDIASWSAMIGGYIGQGRLAQALQLFRELMWKEKLRPDQLTLVTLLSCCATTASMRLLGKSIHAYTEKNGLELNMQLGTALIDMYAKSGYLRSAFSIFERMPERNVMPWSAMICGLALHGCGEEAIALFESMKKAGVRPNEITFTGVLNACCHAGLVEEGRRNFRIMTEQFGIEPGVHHYGCMVDLLGKSGKLDEAYELVKKMKVEPNVVILTSLLASCKVHRSFEIAERLIGQVLEMVNPDEHGGVYTLISDLYALGGKWNDVERVRTLMDRVQVKKKRGSSAIQMADFHLYPIHRIMELLESKKFIKI
uniref:Pentatricopeptide repeat-containing protein At1g33350 n=2 Tax=Anthurium amnicola TaxID=1678845 RepID=A0A1D1Z6H6_9ARAE